VGSVEWFESRQFSYSSMDYTETQTAHDAPPTDAFEPSDRDLKNLFVKLQIEIWGFEQVEEWFNNGFDLIVVNGKVIWVK
jgi:hypothetical protein